MNGYEIKLENHNEATNFRTTQRAPKNLRMPFFQQNQHMEMQCFPHFASDFDLLPCNRISPGRVGQIWVTSEEGVWWKRWETF